MKNQKQTHYEIKDLSLADEGKRRIEWADREMPVLRMIRERFQEEKPLDGIQARRLRAHNDRDGQSRARAERRGGGCVLIASNPLSHAGRRGGFAGDALRGIPVFAIKGESTETYVRHVRIALDHKPNLIIDDGSDVVATMFKERPELIPEHHRHDRRDDDRHLALKAMCASRRAELPVHRRQRRADQAFLRQPLRHRPDRRSTASSARPIFCSPARTLVVVGYGWCGKGVAMRARGMGANVIVTEIDPIKAIEAVMDGFRVMPMAEAAPARRYLRHRHRQPPRHRHASTSKR